MSAETEPTDQNVESSVTDVLQQPAGKQTIKYVVAVFGCIGIGIGLTGLLASSLLGSGLGVASTLATIGSLAISFFAGSIVAAMLTLDGTFDMGYNLSKTYVLSFASTAAGYVVMTLLTLILSSVTAEIDIAQFLGGMVFLSLPTGLTAVLLVWLHRSTTLQPTSN